LFDWVDVIFNADTLFNITASDFQVFSNNDILFESSSFQINAEATLNFESEAGPIIFQANGPDAWIDWYSSGEFEVTATNINFATELGPRSDLRFISSLGRIEFDARTPPPGNNQNSISLISMAGDILFNGIGDDADIYADAATFSFQAGGDFQINSLYNTVDDAFPGQILVSSGDDNFNSQSTIYFSATNPPAGGPIALAINSAAAVNFFANGAADNPGAGGSIHMRLDEIDFASNSATITAPNSDSTVFFISPNTDTVLTAGNQISITRDSRMKIPYNLRIDQCRPGAMFYTDYLMDLQSGLNNPPLGDGSIGYLCVPSPR